MGEDWQELRIMLLFLTAVGIILASIVVVTELLVVLGVVSKKDDGER